MTEPTDIIGKKRLEQAVTKLGKAYDELVRTVEKNGQSISREDLDKVFSFLSEVHQGSFNKSVLSLSTAIACTGGFSLAAYTPSALTVSPTAAPNTPRIPILTPEGLIRGERLAGTGRRSRTDPLEDENASDFVEE